MSLDGKVLWAGDEQYEAARQAVVWNARKPARRPAGIVRAQDAQDVVDAVHLARQRGLQVSVRAGGHSFSAAGVRDGALLIDVGALRDMRIDAAARVAVVGPGRYGHSLNRALVEQGLFFPAGHCETVALGGFL